MMDEVLSLIKAHFYISLLIGWELLNDFNLTNSFLAFPNRVSFLKEIKYSQNSFKTEDLIDWL